MEEFDFKQKILQKLNSLYEIVKHGENIGLDFQFILEKLERMKKVVDDGVVKIVLLGSFSDGKTSAIAGLLGKLEDSMKIDETESSDEITVYRPLGLKKGFEIVDTPGLFGSKEKSIDGHSIRFSDITKNYISEAHIVVYLCDAVVPLKDSHVEIVRKVLRDLNKLDSTIFVINKMDETDVDMLDDDDYAHVSEIKKNNLISRLRSTINLTPDEEKKLRIVCISADPKGKGLKYWLEKWQDYKKRSRIDLFRNAVDDVVEETDALKVKADTSDNTVKEMLDAVCQGIDAECLPMKRAVDSSKQTIMSLEDDADHLKKDLQLNKQNANRRLIELQNRLISEINGMNQDAFGPFIEKEIGVQTNKENGKSEVSFWILENSIRQIFEECGANNQSAIDLMDKKVDFEGRFSESNRIVDDALKKGLEKGAAEGAKYFGNVNVNAEMVKNARNVLAKGYKFKPWGAVKFAGKLNNLAKGFAKVLEKAPLIIAAVVEVWSWGSKYRDNKKLMDLKENLKKVVNDLFAEYSTLMNDSEYFDNLAPGYVELVNVIKAQKDELEKLQRKIDDLEKFKARYDKWVQDNVQDAEIVN